MWNRETFLIHCLTYISFALRTVHVKALCAYTVFFFYFFANPNCSLIDLAILI